MTKPDLTAVRLANLSKSDRSVAIEYAAEVLRDKPTEYFLEVLENLRDSDPDGNGLANNNPYGLLRKQIDDELEIGKFIISTIEKNKIITGGEDVDLAIAIAMNEFGVARSTAFTAYVSIKGDLLRYQLDMGQPSDH